MLPRQRIAAAIDHRPPDMTPLRILPAPGGMYEHGQKLVELIQQCGHDFGDFCDLQLPTPPGADDFDADGRYHAFRTDEWGTTWEYRIFGIWGHPYAWPLNDLSKLDDYVAPAPPATTEPDFEAARDAVTASRQRFFCLGGGGSIFETMHSLRRFEDVLMDIALDTPEINRIADLITARVTGCIQHALALDVDGVTFGDDFGTQSGLIVSPQTWRRFFRPHYKALFKPVIEAGKKIFFHSCGQITDLLEPLKDIGVDVIWPQLPAYDLPELARRCRDLELAVELHPDRGDLMQNAPPQDVRDYVMRLIDTFDTPSGGSWLYLEVDPGFSYPNVEALFDTVMELRAI